MAKPKVARRKSGYQSRKHTPASQAKFWEKMAEGAANVKYEPGFEFASRKAAIARGAAKKLKPGQV
jgi:hypothetical protein